MSLSGTLESQPRVPSLKEAASLLNEALAHRRELAALELAEARGHVQSSALLLGVVILLALLGGLLLMLTVVGLVWDSPHRAWWLAGIGTAHLGGAALTVWVLHRRFQSWQPFAEIRHQLHLDHQCLSRLIQALHP